MTFKFISPTRRAALAAAALLFAAGPGWADAPKTKLLVGFQDWTLPETVGASGVLEGAPYEIQWVVLPGPASQLSALYSKAIDVGHMGDTSLIIEQGKSKTPWVAGEQPLQIVAGWRATDAKYPPIITVGRAEAGVNTLEDLRGKTWAFNFGGFNYVQYLLSSLKSGLGKKDFEPVQLADQNATSAAFLSGKVDAFSGSTTVVAEAIEKGYAKVLQTSDELGIPALNVLTARGDVLRDPAKKAALADFLDRVRKHWAWYAANTDRVEKLLIEKIKQSPARAKISTEYSKATFQPLDTDLIKREQRIADVLFEAKAIPNKIDVSLEFASEFNASTVPTVQN
ncbi:PhnD/SsuA/transferrin family substrate-binding protein [Methylopila sp. Yamaguchi]|uniref:PhnD/SsuA/transferrin family substrate-binding protein n=1 Tax=Methylopila sp. Yamaguchi TaxID=1437817 RepID=UPI000CB13A92|nr:PhnD/SsuA/transferrin family substrate-binding protein [Methylopila sp. Yamaguchi]GBD46808.1 nitrate/sulfonate/bicarbonate ABC transporter periplasmic ligand-binding protein [Methylopila sp. Yamaguchi]